MKIYNLKELGIVFEEGRGWLASIAEFATRDGYEIKNIHLGTIRPGQIRGNHVHARQREWTMVFGGKAIVAWKQEAHEEQKILEDNEQLLFEFNPGWGHAIKNIDTRDIYLVSFTDQEYTKENPDRINMEILKI